jgi:hypothetical protein
MIPLVLLAGALWVALIFALIDCDRWKERAQDAAARNEHLRSKLLDTTKELGALRARMEHPAVVVDQGSGNVVPFPTFDRDLG